MMTGITVQATSISVLWVVLDGTGLARELNLKITISSNASTNSVISVMTISRKSWNQVMLSMIGVADCWKLICQGDGCPSPAIAASRGQRGRSDRRRDQECLHPHRRHRSFDKSAVTRPVWLAPSRAPLGLQPAAACSASPVHGPPIAGLRMRRARGRILWENPDFSNHNSARLAMRLHIEIMRHSAYAKSHGGGPLLGQK